MARAAMIANEAPVADLLVSLEKTLSGVSGKVIAVWGLSFKPKTDDVREAPALRLIAELASRGARIRATDPEARETARARLEQLGIQDRVEIFEDPYEAAAGADALVLATEWSEYRSPDAARLARALKGRDVFDGRNALIPAEVAEAGLVYHGTGRPTVGG
jgi:UDPglucose 6-dehydrogenase